MCAFGKIIFSCLFALACTAPDCPLQCSVIKDKVCASDGSTNILFYNECEFHSYLECDNPANEYDWKIVEQEICSVSGTSSVFTAASNCLTIIFKILNLLIIKYFMN